MIRFERWRPLIEATRTEEALIAVMREYCDTLLPSDMAKLPEGCPACAVQAVGDIGDLAVDFRALDLKYLGSEENHATLHDLALTFSTASEQLKRLRYAILRSAEE